MEFTEVPPATIPTVKVVFGCCGGSMSAILAMALETVAAGAFEGNFVAQAACGEIGYQAGLGTIDGNKTVDIFIVAEEGLYAAQITQSLLADSAAENNVSRCLDSGGIQGPNNRQDGRQAAGIVGDTGSIEAAGFFHDRSVGAFRKDGIQMGGYKQPGSGAGSRIEAEDIAFAVGGNLFEPECLETFAVIRRPDCFLKRRGRNFGDGSLVAKGVGFVSLQKSKSCRNLLARRKFFIYCFNFSCNEVSTLICCADCSGRIFAGKHDKSLLIDHVIAYCYAFSGKSY